MVRISCSPGTGLLHLLRSLRSSRKPLLRRILRPLHLDCRLGQPVLIPLLRPKSLSRPSNGPPQAPQDQSRGAARRLPRLHREPPKERRRTRPTWTWTLSRERYSGRTLRAGRRECASRTRRCWASLRTSPPASNTTALSNSEP